MEIFDPKGGLQFTSDWDSVVNSQQGPQATTGKYSVQSRSLQKLGRYPLPPVPEKEQGFEHGRLFAGLLTSTQYHCSLFLPGGRL